MECDSLRFIFILVQRILSLLSFNISGLTRGQRRPALSAARHNELHIVLRAAGVVGATSVPVWVLVVFPGLPHVTSYFTPYTTRRHNSDTPVK